MLSDVQERGLIATGVLITSVDAVAALRCYPCGSTALEALGLSSWKTIRRKITPGAIEISFVEKLTTVVDTKPRSPGSIIPGLNVTRDFDLVDNLIHLVFFARMGDKGAANRALIWKNF
jgi:hypothetical protein